MRYLDICDGHTESAAPPPCPRRPHPPAAHAALRGRYRIGRSTSPHHGISVHGPPSTLGPMAAASGELQPARGIAVQRNEVEALSASFPADAPLLYAPRALLELLVGGTPSFHARGEASGPAAHAHGALA